MSAESKLKLSDCNTTFRESITEAFGAIATMSTAQKADAKKHIVQELMSLSMTSDDVNKRLNDTEAERFADYTISQIKNKAKVIEGKPNQVEFTPDLLRSSVVLYGRSKIGYKEQRKLSPLVLPSPSKLNKIMRQTRVNEGSNKRLYGHFFDKYVSVDSVNHGGCVAGHLIFDEMKLKTGVFWRTTDHKACGFVSSSSTDSMKDILCDMLEKDNGDGEDAHKRRYSSGIKTVASGNSTRQMGAHACWCCDVCF